MALKPESKLVQANRASSALLPAIMLQERQDSSRAVYGKLSLCDGTISSELRAEKNRIIESLSRPSRQLDRADQVLIRLKNLREQLDQCSDRLSDFRSKALVRVSSNEKQVLLETYSGSWVRQAFDLLEQWQSNLYDPSKLISHLLNSLTLNSQDRNLAEIVRSSHHNFLGFLKQQTAPLDNLTFNIPPATRDSVIAQNPFQTECNQRLQFAKDKLFELQRHVEVAQMRALRPDSKIKSYELERLELLAPLLPYDRGFITSVFEVAESAFSAIQLALKTLGQIIEPLEAENNLRRQQELEAREDAIKNLGSSNAAIGYMRNRSGLREAHLGSLWTEYCSMRSSISESTKAYKIAYLCSEILADSTERYHESLVGLPAPTLKSSVQTSAEVIGALAKHGITFAASDKSDSIADYSVIGLYPGSPESIEQFKVKSILSLLSESDVEQVVKQINLVIEDSEITRNLLTRNPALFALYKESPAVFEDVCFSLLKLSEELKVSNSENRESIKALIREIFEDSGQAGLERLQVSDVIQPQAAKEVLSTMIQVFLSKQESTPQIIHLKDTQAREAMAVELVQQKRLHQLKAALGADFAEQLQTLLSKNPDLLQLSSDNFNQYVVSLAKATLLIKENYRADLDFHKNIELYATSEGLAKTCQTLEKQKAFNQILSALDLKDPKLSPYAFNLLRRGFYFGGGLHIGTILPLDHVLENSKNGELVKQDSLKVFNSNTEKAIKILTRLEVMIAARSAYELNPKAFSESDNSPIGKLLVFLARKVEVNDRFYFNGYYL
jgi:hypothetical protein